MAVHSQGFRPGPTAGFFSRLPVKIVLISLVVLVNATWIALTDFRFDFPSSAKVVALVAGLSAAAWFYRFRRPDPKFHVLFAETALLLAFSAACAVLSYLVTSLNLPLVDDGLMAIDAGLGFDWLAYVGFVNERPWLGVLSSFVYVTTISQVALAVIVLGLAGRLGRARQFNGAVMLGALFCVAVSAVLPAAGALGTIRPDEAFFASNPSVVDLAYKQIFFDLRSGAERFISLDSPHGLIAFPSYHCALSVLVVLAFRGMGWLFWPLAILNGAVILSTPIDGGHHLIDSIGGIAVALVAWKIAGITFAAHAGSRGILPATVRQEA